MSDDDASEVGCCASCGIAEVDDINLKDCDDCDLVKYWMSVEIIIHQSMKKYVRNGPLNYVMNYYSSSRKAVILETVPSAVYLCRFKRQSQLRRLVAVKQFVMAAVLPIRLER